MASQFALDMYEASGKAVAFLLAGLADRASEEVQWIKDHSAQTQERDAILTALAAEWEKLLTSPNPAELEARLAALRDAAISAGPSAMDSALLKY